VDDAAALVVALHEVELLEAERIPRRRNVEKRLTGVRAGHQHSRGEVSIEFVYKAFKNKPGLLKALFDVAIAGDDEPVPITAREWVASIQAEPDAPRKLEMYADHLGRSIRAPHRYNCSPSPLRRSIRRSPRSGGRCSRNGSSG
jgi:hypothetical protein